MTRVAFPPASFDGVAAFYALTHLPHGELPRLLEHVATWLRPGGLLVATMSARANRGAVEPDWLGAPMYFSGYPVEENQRFVERAGLEITSARIETILEQNRPVAFLWVVARKPELATAGTIRRARPEEAPALTALALRSKAHWGYDAAFMAACVAPLTIVSERIAAESFFVLEADGRIHGYYGLRIEGDEAELTNLFVEPWAIGRGDGKRLWRHAVEVARVLGARQLRIESDPFAEPFYRAMGAERVGDAPSDAIPGRMIPLLRYVL